MKDPIIWHQIHLERYKNSVESELRQIYAKMLRALEKAARELTERVENRWTEAAFRDFAEDIARILEEGYSFMDAGLVESQQELVEEEIEWIGGQLQKEVGASVEIALPTVSQVRVATTERPFEGWTTDSGNIRYVKSSPLRQVKEKHIRSLQLIVAQAYVEGRTTREVAKRIEILDQMAVDAETQNLAQWRNTVTEARTSLQQYAITAQEETYRENDDLFPWVEFTATLDHRTTEICGALDGKVWRVKDPNKPHIPQHWNCRSVWVPKQTRDELVDSQRPQVTPGPDYERGDNVTRTGRVRRPRKRTENLLKRGVAPAETRFDSWLRTQDRKNSDFVRDYFRSDKRYREWKEGKLGRIEYTNKDGRTFDVTALSKPEKYVRPALG